MHSCVIEQFHNLNARSRQMYSVVKTRAASSWGRHFGNGVAYLRPTGLVRPMPLISNPYQKFSQLSGNSVLAISLRKSFLHSNKLLDESLREVAPQKHLVKLFGNWSKRIGRRNRAKKNARPNDWSAGKENKTEVLSLAAEMLIQDTGKNMFEVQSDYEEEKRSVDAAFAGLEELAAVKFRKSYPITEDLYDENQLSDNEESSDKVTQSRPRTSFSAPRSGRKMVEFYGTPDPVVPVSHVPCHGCGAMLHCQDPGIPGYLPSQKFLAIPESQLKDITCQRCSLLATFNFAVDVSVEPSEYEAIVNEIRCKTALLLFIVDLTDLPNSFHKTFASLSDRKRPLYVIGNKVDLLPKDSDGYLVRIKESLLKLCWDCGLSGDEDVKHVALISAKTGYGIEELITKLMIYWSRKGQVYLLGCTNAGKSTLFNALLASDFCRSSARDVIKRATTSIWPGTTLNLLKFPIVIPKYEIVHKRIERLKEEQLKFSEEKKLRKKALKASGYWQHASLMGYIGTSISTPKEIAVEEELSKYAGFIVPTYTFTEVDQGNLKQNAGENAVMESLKLKVQPFDESIFKYWCHDTPGLINPDQIINSLNHEELSVLLPRKLLKPRTYLLKPSQVMFVSGLGRINYDQGDGPIYCTVFAADEIPVHVLKQEEVDSFYAANFGSPKLGIPLGDSDRLSQLPPLVGKKLLALEGKGWFESVADVVLSSIGWVSVTAGQGSVVQLTAFTPDGRGCAVRTPPLLKYAINLRGKRIRGTAGYKIRQPKMG